MWYEDHGDPSVDERWRKTLNRQASAAGTPVTGATERLQSGNMWDHVHPLNDLYVPEHERRDPIVSVEDLINDILQ